MIAFKERVKNVAIQEALGYKANLVEYDFLIYSYCFEFEDYYSIECKEENYLHLVGVNSKLSPLDFFDKCINKTLLEADFDFVKTGISESAVKGSVRRKIQILQNMNNIFNGNELYIEENFKKNKVFCSIATTDNICTLGFEMTYKAKPKTLLRGNVLNSKILNVDLVLRKSRTSDKFNEIVLGDMSILLKSYEKLKHELSPRLIEVCEHALAQELSES